MVFSPTGPMLAIVELTLREMDGRLAKYSRFGMTEEEARRATPEHMREAYKRLVADHLADVYTPSPELSIPPTPRSIEFDHPNIAQYSTKRPL